MSGGTLWDAGVSILCVFLARIVTTPMELYHANDFFTTLVATYIQLVVAFVFSTYFSHLHFNNIIIGTLMMLFPGRSFMTAVRDAIMIDSLMIYISAFTSSFFFALLYESKMRLAIVSAFCGLLGKLIFDMMDGVNIVLQFFVPTVIMCIYAEIFARVCKVPVMVITTIGILPIVPGMRFYNTIDSLLNSHVADFYSYGVDTLLSMGAMAIGLVLVSSFARMLKMVQRKVPKRRRFMPKMR